MGRKRSPENAWLPPQTYRGKSAFEFRPRIGGTVILAPLDAPASAVWAAWEKHNTEAKPTIAAMAKQYFLSAQFRDLAPRTQRDHEEYWARLDKVFGHMDPAKLTPVSVRRYMDLRSAKVQANRERSFLQTLYAWGVERGFAASNPVQQVKKFSERARDRYITDAEYQAIYDHASLNVRAAMEISYLCAARMGDVLRLTIPQLHEDGIFIRQNKTGKKQIKRWTPRLRAAVDLARSQPSSIGTMFVLHDKNGQALSKSALQWGWAKALVDAKLKDADIHFHDLKAKGISDFEGDKKKFSGHQSDAMVARYDRKVPIVDTVAAAFPEKFPENDDGGAD